MNNHIERGERGGNHHEKINMKVDIEETYKSIIPMMDQARIKLENFSLVPNPVDLAKDIETAKEAERRFEIKDRSLSEEDIVNQKLAKIFEGVFYARGELSAWLGMGSQTILCSRYDDYINKVDCVAEFLDDDELTHLGLAIDVATDFDLDKKFETIKKEIENGQLTQVKYFVSERAIGIDDSEQKHSYITLSKIPRVVIGATKETVVELADYYLAEKRGIKIDNISGGHFLDKHFIQFQILEEIEIQLEAFKKYAESIKKLELVLSYDKALEMIRKIKVEKVADNLEDDGKRDEMLAVIESNLDRFKSQIAT